MKLFYEDKTRKNEVYRLWQQAFHDPEAFAEYYFAQVYPNNRVMVAVESDRVCSMIHLNPYRWQWNVNGETKKLLLHYIVGVATEEDQRRKGYMAACMRRVLQDLSEQGEPFTYLMPAKEEYYEPFRYVTLKRRELRRYEENRKIDGEEIGGISMIGTPERTEEYLRRLEMETACEGGEILRLEPNGYCACVPEKRENETVLVILQLVAQTKCQKQEQLYQQVLPYLWKQYGNLPVEYMVSQPMMIRITDLVQFVELLPYEGERLIRDCRVTDPICERNQGSYRIILSKDGCKAERIEDGMEGCMEVQVPIEELTGWLLAQTHLAEQLYIMEIV